MVQNLLEMSAKKPCSRSIPRRKKPQASQMTCLEALDNDHSPACFRIMPMYLSQEKANYYQMHGVIQKVTRLF
jgi:hypothetical protein